MLSETWFTNVKQLPRVQDYMFLTKNRSEVYRRARVGSGGVGILIHNKLFESYVLREVMDKFEGILGVVLKHKIREHKVCVITCYLPPEGTKYGCDSEKFFECLTHLVYMYNECEYVYVGGDFNARLGIHQDFITDIDDIAPRVPIDAVSY